MSALARFFNNNGYFVSGYDAVETKLTKSLVDEGISVHYFDNLNLVHSNILKNKQTTLIIYTPAIPEQHSELQYFMQNGFKVLKRAQVLGLLSTNIKTVGIAGTHGKTTISALVAHIFKENSKLNAAFIGGIAKNYKTNFISGNNNPENHLILEADEFDRSFLNFKPEISLISAVDADHLDIYKNKKNLISAFEEFINQTSKSVVLNDKINISCPKNLEVIKYGENENSNIYFTNLRVENEKQVFDIYYPEGICKDVKMVMPGKVNAENSTGAFAVSYLAGIKPENIKSALEKFQGIERRFDLIFKNDKIVYINDYAHHPAEIQKLKEAVRTFYPNRKITAIFQPHLFSRTRDFANGFADSLNDFDEIILLDIYPARELPIDGVSSKIIFDKINIKNKQTASLTNIIKELENRDLDILLTIGAGDIETQVDKIKSHLIKKYKN